MGKILIFLKYKTLYYIYIIIIIFMFYISFSLSIHTHTHTRYCVHIWAVFSYFYTYISTINKSLFFKKYSLEFVKYLLIAVRLDIIFTPIMLVCLSVGPSEILKYPRHLKASRSAPTQHALGARHFACCDRGVCVFSLIIRFSSFFR